MFYPIADNITLGRRLLDEEIVAALLLVAREAAQQAYAPYSDFPVGAALLTGSGEIIRGANVENVSYGLTLCAERCAVFKAVSDGHRDFQAIAVWASRRPQGIVTPCGACRQVLAEFMHPEAVVVTAAPGGGVRCLSLGALLPDAFASAPDESCPDTGSN
jgi:cytidine deaminase